MKIYLAGPIGNVTDEEASQWRDTARDHLKSLGIQVSDPTNRPYIPGNEEWLIQGDLNEIRSADGIIAHIPPGVEFHGTSMEIFFAGFVEKKPVWSWPLQASPWLMYWSNQHETLDDVLYSIEEYQNALKVIGKYDYGCSREV